LSHGVHSYYRIALSIFIQVHAIDVAGWGALREAVQFQMIGAGAEL